MADLKNDWKFGEVYRARMKGRALVVMALGTSDSEGNPQAYTIESPWSDGASLSLGLIEAWYAKEFDKEEREE